MCARVIIKPALVSCVAPVGVMVMARTPISAFGEEETTDTDGPVDASLLPPG